MRFLTIYHPTASEEGGAPSPEHMSEMGALIERMTKSGYLISTEPLTPRDACARLTLADGKFTVAPETTRAGGFAFIEATSKADCIEACKEFLKVAGDGAVEIRQILEFAPVPA
jgi:hypothetical protein